MIDLYNDISIQTSQIITRKYSTSFSTAVRLLPPKIRKAIYSVYGFVRVADEIVDTFEGCDQKLLLDELEQCLETALIQKHSSNPVIQAFVQTVHEYGIDKKHIDAFIRSMRADLYKSDYYNYDETDEYIYGSAKVVGLMCLKVFVNGDQEKYNELEASAMNLGSAFQKVNFLCDLKADFEDLERSYFHNFDKLTFNENVKQQIIEDIEQDFRLAKEGIRNLPASSKLAVWIAYYYYSKLLKKIKRTPAHKIIDTRIRISNGHKLVLLNKAYIRYKMNLI